MSNDLYNKKDLSNNDETICFCQEVTLKTIKKAIVNGAKTVEDIGDNTEAGITCGACIEDIENILEKELKD